MILKNAKKTKVMGLTQPVLTFSVHPDSPSSHAPSISVDSPLSPGR